MWTYQGVYRCKLCGKIFYGDIMSTSRDMIPDNTCVNIFAWHYDCDADRCWGAGDAVGIKIVDDIQENAED